MTIRSAALQEQATYIDVGGASLLAVEAAPEREVNGWGVLLVASPVSPTALHRDRFWVRVARRLAGEGHRVARFDWHGQGDSTGALREETVEDMLGACVAVGRWASERVDHQVLVGSCFGASWAGTAARSLEKVRGVVMLSVPAALSGTESFRRVTTQQLGVMQWAIRAAGRYGRSALLHSGQARRLLAREVAEQARAIGRRVTRRPPPPLGFVSTALLEDLIALSGAGIRVLMVYGEDDDFRPLVDGALASGLGDVIRDSAGMIELRFVTGSVHNLADRSAQDAVMPLIEQWIAGIREQS